MSNFGASNKPTKEQLESLRAQAGAGQPQAKPATMLPTDYAKALENLLEVCHQSQRMGLKDDYPAIGHAVRLALRERERQ
jgi:hypothetical protein